MNDDLVYRGRVKWFDVPKHYGFLTTDAGLDVFVHVTGIPFEGKNKPPRVLRKGQRVEFRIAQTEKGPEARKVRVISQE